MVANRIEIFQQAFRNLQLQPLITPTEIADFRVEYGDEWLDDLEQKVLDCSNSNHQLFFAGHRGCGKSTLLAEFAQRLEDRYFPVFFSITDLIEMSAINHINILFAIALQLMAKADDENIDIEQAKKDEFFNWFKERTTVEESKTTVGAATGFDLFGLIKLKLKTDNTIRDEIKTKFTQNPSDLIDTLNLIATEIELACGKEIVVIIDDLDKLDLAEVEKIFKQNLNILLQPKFTTIYTIPIATIRDGVLKKHIEDATSNRIFVMPVLKLYAKGDSHQADPQFLPKAMNKLREILRKRIDDDLFEADVALNIALFSGGVMRELIRIAQECCRLMLVQLRQKARKQESIEDLQIDRIILNQALDILRNDMTITLSKIDREILTQTYLNYRPDDPKQQEFLDLLHNTYAIEYRNAESWYDLHPLVIRQLKQEKMIP
jgi:energy-coupling factor transporter ATP-binding protein EcfA2